MTNEHCTALVASILLSSPNSTWQQDNPKARERAIDAAARLVQESSARWAVLDSDEPEMPA